MTRHEQADVLVVGLGNTLRGDDALGRVAAERLRPLVEPHRVRVVDQIALTPDLAADLARVSLALFLDASLEGPRDRVVVQPVEASRADSLAHRLEAGALLALAHRVYGRVPRAWTLTFPAQNLTLADCRLSPEAEAASEWIVQESLRLIRSNCKP